MGSIGNKRVWYSCGYMKQKVLSVGLASLLLGLVFDWLFYLKLPGISFFLYCAVLLTLTFLLAAYNKHPLGKFAPLISVPILFFSAMVFVRASGLLTFLNIIFVIYLLLLLVQLAANPKEKLTDYVGQQYIGRVLLLPLAFVRELFVYGQQLLDSRSSLSVNKSSVTPVVRGILLSLPLLFIFLILFSSADLVFKQYVGSLFDFSISPDLMTHLLLVGFVASLCCGAYALIFTNSKQVAGTLRQKRHMTLGTVESSIILGSVAFLFLVFVVIQVAYLFGGQNHLSSAGFTYAEYARKGFFELVVVAVITLVLLLVVNKSTERPTLRQKVTFMWLSGLLVLEVLVIMLSAHKRLALYEQAYGFTTARLFSHIFVGWLAVVFVLLMVHIMREQKQNVFTFQVFLSVIAFMAVLNFINPDALIARKNIDRFNKTGKIDPYYLRSLSEDAVPVTAELLNNSNQELQKTIARNFYYMRENIQQRQDSWQSFNVGRSRANSILHDNARRLEENKDFYTDRQFE